MRSAARAAALDAAARELQRIQKPCELLRGKARELLRDLTNRPALGVGLFGQPRSFLIADDRIQRRDENGIALERLGKPLAIDGEARDGAIGEHDDYIGEQPYALEEIVGNDGQHDIQLKIARLARDGD